MTAERKHRASSRPLVPGGNNYTAMHLIFQGDKIRVKPSFWCYFFAGLLMLPALFFVVFPIAMLKFFDDSDLIFLGIAVTTFAVCGFLVYIAVRMILNLRKRCRSLFDLTTRIFYPCGCNSRETDLEKYPAVSFSDLSSLQIVEEHCSTGKSSFESYELNVVLRDGNRFNLLDHSNKECFAEEAEKLSGILSIPLTDAYGKRLSCDSFLSLPSNIRENLLYSLYSFLIFVLFFALGDGYAWYMTRQSFQWEETPAYVESAKIHKHSGRHTYYSLDFQFRYRYQEKEFTGSDYSFFSMRSSEYAIEKIIQRYPAGSKFLCYVNPRSPQQAVVYRNIPPFREMLLSSPWSCCFLIMSVFCVFKAAIQYHLLKKRRRQ